MLKNFRPPLLKPKTKPRDETTNPDQKRRKICHERAAEPSGTISSSALNPTELFPPLPREPLTSITANTIAASSSQLSADGYYSVLWRKYTAKKHKTWDGDGTLLVRGGYAYLRDDAGKEMGKTACDVPLLPGSTMSMGGKNIEVDAVLSRGCYHARNAASNMTPHSTLLPAPSSKIGPGSVKASSATKSEAQRSRIVSTPNLFRSNAAFKNPVKEGIGLPKLDAGQPTPRHDPTAKDALVMTRPRTAPKGKRIVDVVVDPLMSKTLRPHQRDGVKFLYECIMGMRNMNGQGCLLCDEMGLGKTFQIIALLWTVLKQNPVEGDAPVIKKAIIVCPVTLIRNWRREIRQWLGLDRLGVFVFDDRSQRISDFTRSTVYNVMIIGYEKLRTVSDDLKRADCIDIIIADEGHRLKTAKNKSALALKALDVSRKILLTGTPVQNELGEFFSMVDFVNPGILGSLRSFTRDFEIPLIKSRQPGASQDVIDRGALLSEELASLTSSFILRRTTDVLAGYLPPKTEYVLFCQPTAAQQRVYQHVLQSPNLQSALGNAGTTLQLITILKKVCNSPRLLKPKGTISSANAPPGSGLATNLLDGIDPRLIRDNGGSSKIRVLDQLLHVLRQTDEKVVLVSNYTSTLELFEILLTALGFSFLRLDGSTKSSKRQALVDDFNHSTPSQCFAFLLSAKAGGLGLNLIGASRLVLFDVDWNPATDLQAMARIHRDGQKRPCVIYRFILSGGLDEKIWQRQTTKLNLASNVMDQKGGINSFSPDELKDLFKLEEGLHCQTHELLRCPCEGRGGQAFLGISALGSRNVETVQPEDGEVLLDISKLAAAPSFPMSPHPNVTKDCGGGGDDEAEMEALMTYSHIATSALSENTEDGIETLVADDVLLEVLKDADNRVSFVFAKTSN